MDIEEIDDRKCVSGHMYGKVMNDVDKWIDYRWINIW